VGDLDVAALLAGRTNAWEPPEVRAADPAMVVFTSGSTARPKGAVLSHGALVHHGAVSAQVFAVTAEDRLSLVLPLGFVAAWSTIGPALACGATLVMAEPSDVDLVARAVGAHRVSVLLATPAVLRSVAPRIRATTAVRIVVSGGEPLTFAVARELDEVLPPDVGILNRYSSTETGAVAACHVARPVAAGLHGAVPIGWPTGRAVEVWDDGDRPVDPGLAGQLVVIGDHLASGYVDDPDETARRFGTLADGRRFVRTGDRVRAGATGLLRAQGRRDRRVKVRGVAVDLDALEDALTARPDVLEVAVELLDGVPAAWLVVDGAVPTSAEIRTALATSFPATVLPVQVFAVDALPRSERGKVDRQLLRSGRAVGTRLAPTRGGPTRFGPTEATIAHIWSDVLGVPVDELAPDLSFLAAGGDSMAAMEVLLRLEARFRRPFRWPAAVDHATIAAFDAQAWAPVAARATRDGYALVDMSDPAASDDVPPLVLIPGNDGRSLALADVLACLQVHGRVWSVEAMEGRALDITSVRALAANHAALLAAIGGGAPPVLVGLSSGGTITIELARRMHAAGTPAAAVVLLDTFHPSLTRSRSRRNELQTSAAQARWWLRRRMDRAVGAARTIRPGQPAEPEPVTPAHLRQIRSRAARRYRPQPVPFPLVLVVSEARSQRSPTLGWERIATVEARAVPGTHRTFRRSELAHHPAAVLDDVLRRAARNQVPDDEGEPVASGQ
jgi:thioesterase domain-containing protein